MNRATDHAGPKTGILIPHGVTYLMPGLRGALFLKETGKIISVVCFTGGRGRIYTPDFEQATETIFIFYKEVKIHGNRYRKMV